MDHHDNDHQEFVPPHIRLARAPESEYDALADLFLGDGSLAPAGGPADPEEPTPARATGTSDAVPTATPAARPQTAERSVLEAVVLGHLPVRASIWVRQYASSIADQTHAPVVLLRVGSEVASLELIGAPPTHSTEPCSDLREAIRVAKSSSTARWIIRVEETAEPVLTENAAIDEVTLLTGSDEAALVASYRLAKSLAMNWDVRFGEQEGPKLRMAIMGASPAQAIAARAKIERAAHTFLDRPVEVGTGVARIGSASVNTLFRGPCEVPVDEMLASINDGFEDENSGSLRLASVAAPSEPAPVDSGPPITVSPEAEPEITVVAADPPAPRDEATRVASSQEPERADLAGLVGGLSALESRCPYSPKVELAADENGRLHLLVASDDEDARARVEQLVAASTWADAHLALLRRCEPLLSRHAPAPPPVLHVMTSSAKSVRSLLDADMRLHLLTRVELGGQVGWVTNELN